MDIPDGPRPDNAIDLSTPEAAEAFFRRAKATVAAHGLERTVLGTSGFDEIKRDRAGSQDRVAAQCCARTACGRIPILAYNFKLLNSKPSRSAPTRGRWGRVHQFRLRRVSEEACGPD